MPSFDARRLHPASIIYPSYCAGGMGPMHWTKQASGACFLKPQIAVIFQLSCCLAVFRKRHTEANHAGQGQGIDHYSHLCCSRPRGNLSEDVARKNGVSQLRRLCIDNIPPYLPRWKS